MKHLTFANKSLLVGDDLADVVIEYAAVLANEGEAKSLDFRAYSDRGDNVTATVLLGAGAPLMAETVTSDLTEPDNALTIDRVRAEIAVRTDPPNARPMTEDDVRDEGDARDGRYDGL